jgi:enoyl-CoA hydratase/carnithine racemase
VGVPDVLSSAAAGVATIRMNRPEVLNAFDRGMLVALRAALAAAVADTDIHAVVLTGSGRSFCSGEDLRSVQALDGAGFEAQIAELQALASALRGSPKPVIAAVAGPAYGGGVELAVNCDVRIAAAGATFACPETSWALTITNGASVLLRRLVGDGWAREIALLGTVIDAVAALRIGLVTRVVPADALEREAQLLAAQAGALDPGAVAATKRLLNADPGPWQAVLDAEAAAVAAGFGSPAARARLATFGVPDGA